MPTSDRDEAIRTRADLVGLVLTLGIMFLSGVLRGVWLLLPAGYWTLLLALRLVAPDGGRKSARRGAG